MKYRSLFVLLICSLALIGCGDDGDTTNHAATNNTAGDAGTDAEDEDAGDEDVATIGDTSQGGGFDHRCDDAPLTDWPLHEEVSGESITTTSADGVMTIVVEATAGGSQASSDNPFIYLDLATGEKVEVNDVEAYSNTDWDLAFKRYVIRTNSADSGQGDVSLVKQSDTTFAEVTSAPSDAVWEQDMSYEDDCTPITDPIGTLVTAFNYVNPGKDSGSWYDYPGITPTDGEVYIVEVPEESKTYKMEIETWNSGVFTIHVAEL